MRTFLMLLPLSLFGAASAASCTVASAQQALKGPVSTTYQIVTRGRVIAGRTLPGKTTVQTTTIKAIPNGVQMTMTENGKSNVVKTTCVNGKTVMELNGKTMPAELTTLPQGSSVDLKGAMIDFNKHKVGDVWSGVLSSVKTAGVSSESRYTNKILGLEKVITPAGTFDAYKVEQQLTVKMTMPNLPKDVKMPNMDSKSVTTSWYTRAAPHMLVKSVSDGTSMTLLKYSR